MPDFEVMPIGTRDAMKEAVVAAQNWREIATPEDDYGSVERLAAAVERFDVLLRQSRD